MKYLFIILACMISIVCHAADNPHPGLIVSPLHYWIEPDGPAYSVENVEKSAQWQLTEGELNLGYDFETLWFKQELSAQIEGDWILQIPYPLLDYLDFYVYEGKTLLYEIRTGDALPLSQKALKVNDFVIGLTGKPDKQYKVIGRVSTQGTLMLPIRWRTEEGYAEQLAIDQSVYGVFYGVLIIMALYHFFIYLVVRERGYLLYVFSVSALVLLQLTFDGRGFVWFWPDTPEINRYSFPLAYSVYLFAIFSFMTEFLKLKDNAPNLYRLFLSLRVSCLLFMLASLILPYNVIIPIIVMTAIFGLISGFLSGAYLWIKGFTPARFFTCAWAMFLAGVILLNFRGLGFGDTNVVSQYGYLLGAILEVLFLAFSLADRINSTRKEKRATEQDLRRSQQENVKSLQRYQELYEHSPIGNFQAGSNYRFLNVNQACAKLFGFDDPYDVVKGVVKIKDYLKFGLTDFKMMIDELRRNGSVQDKEFCIQDRNGVDKWISLTIRYKKHTEGNIASEQDNYYEGSIQDITERKNAENLRLELDQERISIVEKFSIGIAKEINTPLGSNMSTMGYLRESLSDIKDKLSAGEVSNTEYESFIELCYQSTGLVENNQKRMTKVIKRFKEVSSQHLGLEQTHFKLLDVINETVESQRWKMAGWRVNIVCHSEIEIKSLPKAISVILIQLIDNALIHSQADQNQDPKIWIRVSRDQEGKVAITFTDNGQGIKREMVKNLCQPFFTTRRGPEGHIGLGLYMIYSLVSRSLNGRVFFPVIGTGFCVQIVIPKNIEG